MNSNIFIPKKIKVGYQKRSDTYTQKLAYVIYYDEKNKLRKEGSWEGWRDKKIDPSDFDNIPTSGFVLNKKVGDYKSDWNHRQAYTRVYDPRGFEFEITIQNLLYILENTNSIKGKGLEGDFVYGWEGKDIILLPVDSPDYKDLTDYTEKLYSKDYIKAKDLVIGATYKNKKNEQMIYLGRFDHHDYLWERDYYGTGSCEYNSVKRYRNMGLHYFFVDVDYDENEEDNSIKYKLTTMKSISSKFIDTVSPECTPRYADLYSALEHCDEFSPYDSTKDEYIPYTFEEVAKRMTKDENGYYCSYMSCFNGNDNKPIDIRRYHSGNQYEDVFYIEGEYQQYVKNPTGWGTHRNPNPPTESLEEIFNRVNPSYKKLYLENGKSYGYERKYY